MGKDFLTILNIDDDQGCRHAAARFFTIMCGHKVEVAENGREGLRKAASIQPDIILLDMHMPDMTGFQVMEALYSAPATRRIPVIVITGAHLNDRELNSLKAKRNFMFLEQKPVKFGRLLQKLERIRQPGLPRTEAQNIFSDDPTEPA